MRANNDHNDDDVAKPQSSRPRTLSSDHGDAEQSNSKRPRFSVGETLRQSVLPFKPIAKAKSEGHKPTASTSRKATAKGDSGEEEGSTSSTSKFFPGRGRTLGESSKGTKSSSGSEQHSSKKGSSSNFKPNKSWSSGGGRNFKPKGDGESFAARKDRLKNIAATTLEAIDHGSYECEGKTYDLAATVQWMNDHTIYYPPKGELEKWNNPPSMDVDTSRPILRKGAKNTEMSLMQLTTLEGSRWMHAIVISAEPRQKGAPRIGVLNFASAKKPGGGFINGARAQEESIARSSTLYPSLMNPTGQKFYTLHHADARGGFYTHAMIYSPRVQLIKNDAGDWLEPIEVDMITSPAVNAGDVRNKYNRKHRKKDEEGDDTQDAWKQDKSGKWTKKNKGEKKPKAAEPEDSDDSTSQPPEASSKEELEEMINAEMYERMARILYLCQIQSIPNLVLGSFGTGVFRNDVETVAEMWMRLLHGDKAPFSGVFERVVFAIMDKETVFKFANVLGDYGIEVTAPRDTGDETETKWEGKGRALEEASTDVSMQDMSDMSPKWKIL